MAISLPFCAPLTFGQTAPSIDTSGNGTARVTLLKDGTVRSAGDPNSGLQVANPYTIGIPAGSLFIIGDGIGVAGSAILSGGSQSVAAFIEIKSDGRWNTPTGVTRASSLNGSGSIVTSSNNLFEITGAGAGNYSGSISGGMAGGTLGGGSRISKSGGGTQILSGTNTNASIIFNTGANGTLQFAKRVSLYNADTTKWTATNLTTSSGAITAFNVGGTGEFTATDFNTLKSLSNTSNSADIRGFRSGSLIGMDTTNAGSGGFSYSDSIANTTAGTLGFAKLGTNVLNLGGSHTYTGNTLVRSGTLNLTGSLSAGSSVNVSSGATLTGGGSIGGALTVSGTHSPGPTSGVPGSQAIGGSLSYQTASIFEWNLNANNNTDTSGYDRVLGNGATLTIASSTILRILLGSDVDMQNNPFWSQYRTTQTWSDVFGGFSSVTGSFGSIEVIGGPSDLAQRGFFTTSGGSISFTAVPEPSGVIIGFLLATGSFYRRRS